ncbi:MAG: AAA family ATPase [Ectobacillus sp.]
MNENTYAASAFSHIQKQMHFALTVGDTEAAFKLISRTFRLFPDFPARTVQEARKQIGQWYEEIACLYERKGEYEEAERSWLKALSYNRTSTECRKGYSCSILRTKGIDIRKSIEENVKLLENGNGHQMAGAICRAKLVLQKAKQDASLSGLLRKIELLFQAVEQSCSNRPYKHAELTLTDVIGLEVVKQKLNEIFNLVEFNKLRRQNGLKTEPISLHMVFAGNPGTGKTMMARHVAHMLKAIGVLSKGQLVEASRADLVASYVGQTAPKTMAKIEEAMGGILFIDEAYSLTRNEQHDFGMEAIDTLVKAMEDRRDDLIVILAGYPKEMEHFIQSNPGLRSRFNQYIQFPDYTLDELISIQECMLRQREYEMTEEAKRMMRSIFIGKVLENPTTHGNARLVRNVTEELIMKKAAHTMESGKQENLRIIDEEIVRLIM